MPSAQARIGSGPLVFSGVPPILLGEIELTNPSDQKLKLRSIPIVGHDDKTAASRGLHELRVGARLAPQQRAVTPAHFVVDPYTPPGTYRANLAVGDQQQPVVVHVFEKLDLHIDPATVSLRGAGGDVVRQQLVIRNHGNVPETLREVALVFLEERYWVTRSLVFALRETAENEGHQPFLDRAVKELRATLISPVRIILHGAANALDPGLTAEVELEITLPKELIKGRFYIGSTPFMSGKLAFQIECNGSVNSTARRPR